LFSYCLAIDKDVDQSEYNCLEEHAMRVGKVWRVRLQFPWVGIDGLPHLEGWPRGEEKASDNEEIVFGGQKVPFGQTPTSKAHWLAKEDVWDGARIPFVQKVAVSPVRRGISDECYLLGTLLGRSSARGIPNANTRVVIPQVASLPTGLERPRNSSILFTDSDWAKQSR
jgi:hypothetical protein